MLESVLKMRSTAGAGGAGGAEVEVLHSVAHRWGAAFPTDGAFEAAVGAGGCLSEPSQRVVGCGDFCVSPKVEGAALSGAAAATQILGMLKPIPSAL